VAQRAREAAPGLGEAALPDFIKQTFLHYADHRTEALRLITKAAPHNP
jgi:hypothetical protein